jgi:hypothetical protein
MTPDPEWIPFLKVLFGFLLVVILAILAAIIALGKVDAATSFGLDIILGGLMVLCGGFAQWAFRINKKDGED